MQRAAAPPQPPRPARLRNENPGAAGIFSFHPFSHVALFEWDACLEQCHII